MLACLLIILSTLDRIYHNMFHFCSLVWILMALYLTNLVFILFFQFLNLITVILLILRIFEALLFCKLLDNNILEKFHDKLCTSDHQFGFKPKRSTNMCTIVLKETLLYYSSYQSSVYCTFLDARKAFDRVQYCKLFRILIRRGLPACIVRILAVL